MKNFHPLLEHCVTRLKVSFRDDIGNEKDIYATGFWIRISEQEQILVTNRHNLDPGLKDVKFKNYKVSRIQVQERERKNGIYTANTKFVDIELQGINGRLHSNADVAILIFSQISSLPKVEGYAFEALKIEDLADITYLETCCEIFDMIGFIGFPQDWYDTDRNAPSGRTAWLASNPCISFSNKKVATKNTTLVTGLSFGGGSGSPVFSFPKGIKITSSYAPPRLMGIMSGHFWDDLQSNATGFPSHSGFSYFTRSLAIRELLDEPFFDVLDYWN